MKDAAILTGCSKQRRSEPAGSGGLPVHSAAHRIFGNICSILIRG